MKSLSALQEHCKGVCPYYKPMNPKHYIMSFERGYICPRFEQDVDGVGGGCNACRHFEEFDSFTKKSHKPARIRGGRWKASSFG